MITYLGIFQDVYEDSMCEPKIVAVSVKIVSKIIFLMVIFTSQSVSALTIAIPSSTPSMLRWEHILKEIYRRADIPLDFVTLPTQRALVQSSEGIIDGELVRIEKVGDLFPTLVRVPTSYGFFESRAFSRVQGIQKLVQENGWNALRDYRVGIVRGMKFAEEIDIKNWENVEVVTETDQLFQMLELDRIDIAISTKISGLVIMKKHDLKSIHLLEPAIRRHDLFHYLHEKNKKYIPRLDEVIRAMKASGELDELEEKFTTQQLQK